MSTTLADLTSGRAPMPLGRRSAFLALALAPAVAVSIANAEPLVLSYVVEAGGFRVAEATLVLYEAPNATKVELVIQTVGVSAWFKGQQVTTMQAEMRPDKLLGYRPYSFVSKQQKPDRTRDVFLSYDDDGRVADLTVLSKGRHRESAVPADLRDHTVDPLTALLQVRFWLQTEPAVGDELRLTMFDGRKLGELEVRNLGADPTTRSQRLEGKINGLVGYDDGDRLATLPGEPDNWLNIETRDDGSFLPIEIRTRESAMAAIVRLAAD